MQTQKLLSPFSFYLSGMLQQTCTSSNYCVNCMFHNIRVKLNIFGILHWLFDLRYQLGLLLLCVHFAVSVKTLTGRRRSFILICCAMIAPWWLISIKTATVKYLIYFYVSIHWILWQVLQPYSTLKILISQSNCCSFSKCEAFTPIFYRKWHFSKKWIVIKI